MTHSMFVHPSTPPTLGSGAMMTASRISHLAPSSLSWSIRKVALRRLRSACHNSPVTTAYLKVRSWLHDQHRVRCSFHLEDA
jgi:hypothetical protein